MPSVTQSESPTLSSGKKRRRDADDGGVQMPLYGPPSFLFTNSSTDSGFGHSSSSSSTTQFNNESQNLLSAINHNERLIFPPNRGAASSSLFNVPRKVVPVPVSKRFRLVGEPESQHNHHHLHHHYDDISSSSSAADHHPQSQQSCFSHAHPTPPISPQVQPHQTRPAASRANSSALLDPCHICHRKPTKKSDLDSFADCMGCGQRTCFVCIRACQGWLSSSVSLAPEDSRACAHAHAHASGSGEPPESQSASFTMHDVDDDDNNNTDNRATADPSEPSERQKKGEGGDQGWSGRGHREVVCSRCCVERGSEGDVVCLGCLAGMEGV